MAVTWDTLDQGTRDLFTNTWQPQNVDPRARWEQEHAAALGQQGGGGTNPVTPATGNTTPGVITWTPPPVNTGPPEWLQELFNRPMFPPSYERRMALQNFIPNPGKDRLSRSLAAIFSNVPEVREAAINASDYGVTDYQTAAKRYLTGLGDEAPDPIQWAVEQGFMPKLPARTLAEMVDERTLEILKGQNILAPSLQDRVNQQLEAMYQAELAGTEPPEVQPMEGGGRFLPPIPSMQLWNRIFNAPEREGAATLFDAIGLTPDQLADQIGRLAPPSGQSAQAQQVFRRQ